MGLERLVSHEEVDVLGCARVPVGPNRESPDEPMPNAQAGQLRGGQSHRTQHPITHDVLQQAQVGHLSSQASASHRGKVSTSQHGTSMAGILVMRDRPT